MLKKTKCLNSREEPTNEDKVKVIDELRHKYKLKVLLKIADMKKSTYEYYKSKRHIEYILAKEKSDKEILDKILVIYNKHKKRYGYIRINLELNKKMHINQKKTQRIMRENGLKGIQGKNGKFHTYKGDNGLIKENLLLHSEIDSKTKKQVYIRDFNTNKPNLKWTTDVSEFKINAGKLYLSPILDMYDGSIISFDISRSPNFNQTRRMLDMAFNKYQTLDGLTLHSDRGWQYQMKYYQCELEKRGIKQSFSRKGNCMDNGIMENFFGIMKNEMFYGHEKDFTSLDILKDSMIEYIDYYNNERINKKRKGLTPLEYRQQYYILNNNNII